MDIIHRGKEKEVLLELFDAPGHQLHTIMVCLFEAHEAREGLKCKVK